MAEPVGRADDHHGITHSHRVRVGQDRDLAAGRHALELDQRQIGGRLRADDLRGDLLAAEELDDDLFHRVHDVGRGHDLAIGRDEHSGSGLDEPRHAGRLDVTALGADHHDGRVGLPEEVAHVLPTGPAGNGEQRRADEQGGNGRAHDPRASPVFVPGCDHR